MLSLVLGNENSAPAQVECDLKFHESSSIFNHHPFSSISNYRSTHK